MLKTILKLVKTIDSCENTDQMESAKNMVDNFILTVKPKDQELIDDLKRYHRKAETKLIYS